jgi:hypothetical protein
VTTSDVHTQQPGAAKSHPRTIGWIGTTAMAIGRSNQSLFLMAALFVGQGSIPGQGSAAVSGLATGLRRVRGTGVPIGAEVLDGNRNVGTNVASG